MTRTRASTKLAQNARALSVGDLHVRPFDKHSFPQAANLAA
jgi:hypothetical protein